MEYDRDFLTGTVTLLLLGLLSERSMCGSEILAEAERRSARQFVMKEGTLYPALHRMERAGLLTSEWRTRESGRNRRFYVITAKGTRKARAKRAQWDAISVALRLILGEVDG
jgi:PadR family transcriptional regulator, regulatory protein PadR